MPVLFDMQLRAERRDRAARIGPELFLYERVFADCLDRLSLLQRRFGKAALIGCPDAGWPDRLRTAADDVDAFDPGRRFAEAAGGRPLIEDQWDAPRRVYDLVVAIGTLDTVNDVAGALRSVFSAMKPNALLIGALSGGETLPQLRSAMRAADVVAGVACPHVHPRIEAAALAPLLSQAGFARPVVDVDRVEVSYQSFERLVADLRAMGATNILAERSRRSLSKPSLTAAQMTFSEAGDGHKTIETFEILHFAAWTPGEVVAPRQ